jgi:hypothetical protein
MGDDRVCPVCKALNNYTWTFTPESGVPTTLDHNGKVVWNESSGSEAHGHKGNCRCHLTAGSDLSDLLVMARKLRDEVRAAYGGVPP